MAASFYNSWCENQIGGKTATGFPVDFENDDMRFDLVDTGAYTVDLVNHDYGNDLAGVVASTSTLQGGSVAFDGTVLRYLCNNITINGVTGNTVEALVLYKYNATAANAPLVMYQDDPAVAVTPNGGNITININSAGVWRVPRS